MSCFMCEPSTFDTVYRALCHYHPSEGHIMTPIHAEDFVKRLILYNDDAIFVRYPDKHKELRCTREELAEYWWPNSGTLANIYPQAVKCLQCIDYQCSDSKRYRDTMQKTVQETIYNLMLRVVSLMPEYKEQEWR